MSFADHLDDHREPDGSYDLTEVEAAYAEELRNDPDAFELLVEKAAKQGRRAWESNNRSSLRKQWDQPALSPELDLEQLVPVGDDVAIEYGSMDADLIGRRKDLRTKQHLGEIDAYQAEMRHWFDTQAGLSTGKTIADSIQ